MDSIDERPTTSKMLENRNNRTDVLCTINSAGKHTDTDGQCITIVALKSNCTINTSMHRPELNEHTTKRRKSESPTDTERNKKEKKESSDSIYKQNEKGCYGTSIIHK